MVTFDTNTSRYYSIHLEQGFSLTREDDAMDK